MDPHTVGVNWLNTARELEAMAQTGLHFSKDRYDQERYARLREIAAQMLAEHSTLGAEEILDWSRSEFGYATPKVDVRAVIVEDDKLLLVREKADDGKWSLPGGWADVNESPSESVIREVQEECGCETKVLRLLGVLDRERQGHKPSFPYHVYKLFFHCEITGGVPAPSAESSEAGFFAVEQLPELSRTRVLEAQIRRFFQAIKSNANAAEFD